MKKRIRRGLISGGILCGTVGLAVLAYLWFPRTYSNAQVAAMVQSESGKAFAADLARGERMFNIGGCGSCHKSGEEDGKPVLGGYTQAGGGGTKEAQGTKLALHAPVGTFYPSNISPDAEHGIGGWTDGEFVTAMKLGVSPDGRHYYPAFPFTAYAKATTEDLLHLKAYLTELPASANEVPDHDIGFPFSLRLGNGVWKALFHDSATFVPDPNRSQTWNFGAYVVKGFGHCGTCHTPRTFAMNEDPGRFLWGAPKLEAGQKNAPALAGLSKISVEGAFDEWAPAFNEASVMYKVSHNILKSEPSDPDSGPSTIAALSEYLSSLPVPPK